MRLLSKMAAIYRMDYFALVLLFSFGGASARSKAELELSATELRQGDDLNITCKITEKERFDIGRIYRKTEGIEDGPVESEISSNKGIATALRSTGRYENLDYVPGTITIIKIRISDITGADGGIIGCTKLNDGEEAEERITILVPPKSVTMYYMASKDAEPEEIPDGGNITLMKGQENGIRCKAFVDGSRTKPKTRITVGEGDDVQDITGRFTHKHKKGKFLYTSGLLNETRNDTYTWMTSEPNTAEGGKKITCTSELNDFDPISTSATMHIHFMPEWASCAESWNVKPGATNVQLSCRARMYPAGTTSAWSIGKKPNRTVLVNEDKDETMTYDSKVVDVGSNTYEYILTIGEVKVDHFGKRFKLEVSNELGTIERKITLHEGEENKLVPMPGRGSNCVHSSFLVLVLIILALFWQH